MKKILKVFLVCILSISMFACTQKEKNEWKEYYQLTYFYIEDCTNCQYFRKSVLPAIKEEFGDHMKIKEWNMDDDETFEDMKNAYNSYIDNIIDFNDEDYGYGPFVVLEGYFAILGAGNADDYVDNLVKAIKGEKLNKAAEIETRYYFKDGQVQPDEK